MLNIVPVKSLESEARLALYQGGKLVHAPAAGLGSLLGFKTLAMFPGNTDLAKFQSAALSGLPVIVPARSRPYTLDLQGVSITFASNTYFLFAPGVTLDMNVDGQSSGFHFPTGISNAGIYLNGATITCANTANNPDGYGGYGGLFTIGEFFYAVAPATPVSDITIAGPANITCDGASLNNHVVDVFGYARNIHIGCGKRIWATGWTNFVFSLHWGYTNASATEGVFPPNATYHPDLIYWDGCTVEDTATGNAARCFSAAAGRRVYWNNCHAIMPTILGWNLFVGDYGFQFEADNDADCGQPMQYHIDASCTFVGAVNAFTTDGQSTGVNGTEIWTGTDHGTKISGTLNVTLVSSTTDAVAFSGSLIETVDLVLNVREEGTTNTATVWSIFGIKRGVIRGEVVARFGTLIRASDYIDIDVKHSTPLEEPDSARYCIQATASAVTGTTDGVSAVGSTSVDLSAMSSALVTGAGGYLEYSGSTVKILQSTFNSTGAQTLTVEPLKVEIPDASAVSIIQSVRHLRVGPAPITGYASAIRITGSSTEKVEKVTLDGTCVDRCGVYDMDINAVRYLNALYTRHSNSGQRTTTTARRGITLGADVGFARVIGPNFDDTCDRLSYLVYCTAGSTVFVDEGYFGSINTGFANHAAILRTPAVRIGRNNVTASTVPLAFSSGTFTNIIASGAITVTDGFHIIDTEAAAATDDLDTINGGYPGMRVFLKTASSSRDVTVKDGTGNIQLPADFVMDNTADVIELVTVDGTNWFQASSASNA